MDLLTVGCVATAARPALRRPAIPAASALIPVALLATDSASDVPVAQQQKQQ